MLRDVRVGKLKQEKKKTTSIKKASNQRRGGEGEGKALCPPVCWWILRSSGRFFFSRRKYPKEKSNAGKSCTTTYLNRIPQSKRCGKGHHEPVLNTKTTPSNKIKGGFEGREEWMWIRFGKGQKNRKSMVPENHLLTPM